MEWIIKIEEKKDRRILIIFDAIHETIKFIGQFKPAAKDMISADIKNGYMWINISEDQHIMNIDFETLKEYITKVYDKMDERLKIHEDLSKTFEVFKKIEIKVE